jgi:hypothetical protein
VSEEIMVLEIQYRGRHVRKYTAGSFSKIDVSRLL